MCLDNRPDAARTRRRDRDTNLPDHPLRQTRVASNVRPGVTAIGRLVQAAVGSPADIVPGKTLQLIERRVEHIGVGRVHREVERAGPIALVQDLLPGLATVLRAIDAPLGVGPEDVAHGCHEHDVGILGVDADLRDVAGFLEPHVGPCLSAIGRLVDPVSRCQVLSRQRFARADVHHGGVRQGHVDRPYRRRLEETVGDVPPVGARVLGLPDAAVTRAEVKDEGILGISNHRRRPAPSMRADLTPLQRRQEVGSHPRIVPRGRCLLLAGALPGHPQGER